jgi:hypothetical protein
VETNPSVQIMETSIGATWCWSKRRLIRGGRGDVQNSWEVGRMICKGTFANHPSHLLWALLWINTVWLRLKFP